MIECILRCRERDGRGIDTISKKKGGLPDLISSELRIQNYSYIYLHLTGSFSDSLHGVLEGQKP
jgi:hypothetical protein